MVICDTETIPVPWLLQSGLRYVSGLLHRRAFTVSWLRRWIFFWKASVLFFYYLLATGSDCSGSSIRVSFNL